MSEWTLSDDVVEAVIRHMNGDHLDDNAVICRGLGGRKGARRATMTGLDETGVEFLAVTGEGDVTVRVPFSGPILERADIRTEVARMFHESAAIVDGGMQAPHHG